ncbi:MAG: hypothetical protein NC336_04995 [Clostridium sp.]|nr:hypothetical protein [Clostridium sp.]
MSNTLLEMLAENRRRNTLPKFDPISGSGAPGKRVRVKIEGLEPAIQYVPVEMKREQWFKILKTRGSVATHLKDIGRPDTPLEREPIVRAWERMRCRYDFYFWAARFVKIKNKTGNICPFILNAPQRRLIESFERRRRAGRPVRLVLLKARQWGGSTATQLYMAWIQLIHTHGWNSLIVGHQSSSTAEVAGMFELMLEEYPLWLLFDENQEYDPKAQRITGVHGTSSIRRVPLRQAKIKFGSAERTQAVRGGDSAMVHCTEVAFWKNTPGGTPQEMMKSATSGVLNRPLTMIVYESSANGVGNFFHAEYEAAKRGESQFDSLFVAWHEIETYTLPFTPENAPGEGSSGLVPRFATAEELARWMLLNRYCPEALSDRTVSGRYIWSLWEKGATLEAINWYVTERSKYADQSDMASEFPSDDLEAFAHSGTRVFSLDRLEQMRADCRTAPVRGELAGRELSGEDSLRDIRFEPSGAGLLKVWERPADPAEFAIDNRYVVTVDIGGRSAKADWSVIWVVDRSPLLYGAPAATVAQWRGHTDMDLLAWKAAQIAAWYNNALLVIESNTIETAERDRAVDGDQSPYLLRILRSSYDNLYHRPGGRPGFHTNVATKPMVISTLVRAVREGLFVERDPDCIDELACYERRPDGSFGAIIGRHDDILMTRAIGLHIALVELTAEAPVSPRRRRPTDLFAAIN